MCLLSINWRLTNWETEIVHQHRPSSTTFAGSRFAKKYNRKVLIRSLAGLRQHTGDWPGKTVEYAKGKFEHNDRTFYSECNCYGSTCPAIFIESSPNFR
ncbi:MAG: hypothetical protein GX020_05290 [Firmicutes bacterium]|nr:hypothetical protein [Bacillota bacterium]